MEPNSNTLAPLFIISMHDPGHPKESHISDQTLLVLLAQTGDRTALEQLLRSCHAPLRRYITRLAGPISPTTFSRRLQSKFSVSSSSCASLLSSMPGLSVSPRASLSPTLNAPTAGKPSTTLHSQPSLPVPTLVNHPTPPSSHFLTTSRPPAGLSFFFITSMIFHSKKPQRFSTFRSAPPSHVSTMESRPFVNISLSKGNQHEP